MAPTSPYKDALEASLTAHYVPQEIRGISCGALGTVNGVGDLISSVVVGFLWTAISPVAGFGFAAAVMGIGSVVMARVPGEPLNLSLVVVFLGGATLLSLIRRFPH